MGLGELRGGLVYMDRIESEKFLEGLLAFRIFHIASRGNLISFFFENITRGIIVYKYFIVVSIFENPLFRIFSSFIFLLLLS